MITISGLGLVFAGTDPVTEYLLNNTEARYQAFEPGKESFKHVVVLAGGYTPAKTQPLTAQLGPQTLTRLVEGIRIHHTMPGSTLVVTGRGTAKERTEAQAMGELALYLGVDPERLVLENESRNTWEHAYNLLPIVGHDPFVLVTSALHMPRALRALQSLGMKPIPAPTQHVLSGNYRGFNLSKAFITSDNLKALDEWFFEFWARRKYELAGPRGPAKF